MKEIQNLITLETQVFTGIYSSHALSSPLQNRRWRSLASSRMTKIDQEEDLRKTRERFMPLTERCGKISTLCSKRSQPNIWKSKLLIFIYVRVIWATVDLSRVSKQ